MFNAVSETAIMTLKSRVLESQGIHPVIEDEMGKFCYDSLVKALDEDTRSRIINRKTSPTLTRHIAIRARYYDRCAAAFLKAYEDGLVVSLGAGLDTRYWRLGLSPEQYMELDLPEMVTAKKALFGQEMSYRTIAASVLDESWIDDVAAIQSSHVLFIAEGLLMYLHEEDVKRLIHNIAESFRDSRLVVEVVSEKYTRGINKKMVEMKIRSQVSNNAGAFYNFGLKEGKAIESFHPRITLREEWSYFEDPDVGSAALSWLGRFRMFNRSQWTLIADII